MPTSRAAAIWVAAALVDGAACQWDAVPPQKVWNTVGYSDRAGPGRAVAGRVSLTDSESAG